MLTAKKVLLTIVSALMVFAFLVGCAAPTPEVVEVEKTVEVEVEVEKTVEVETVVVATPTSPPARDVVIVALAAAPTSLDPADHRSRQSETVIRNMFDGLVTLGTNWCGKPMRLVKVETFDTTLLLAVGVGRETMGAELVGLAYRYRWQIELFFKWIKCILKCRHLLAESPSGVRIQLYCALIAAMMLFALTGRKPTKRDMEMIQFYLCGIATLEELNAALKTSG